MPRRPTNTGRAPVGVKCMAEGESTLWAGKVVGLRVELPGAASGIVRDLVEKAWKSKAPKGRAVARASVGRKDAGS